MIRSRVMAGLERARARGVRLGRPRTGAKVEAAVRARLAAGDGIKKAAKAVGVGNGTVSRIKAAMAARTHLVWLVSIALHAAMVRRLPFASASLIG